jgi:transcription antitermination factor NusG
LEASDLSAAPISFKETGMDESGTPREYLPNERVVVREGPFRGFRGVVEEVLAGGLVRVRLVLYGRDTPIDFEGVNLLKTGEE